MKNSIKVNSIVTSFDGRNYWPMKALKVTEKRVTVVECDIFGNETGKAVTRKIDDIVGEPSMQFHPREIVYLTRPYDKDWYMANSDI